jgi:protein SCO1/2
MKMFAKLLTSLALVLSLGACTEQKMAFHGVDITGADYAKELNLTDQNGQPRTLKDFAGKVVVVFFGYTQCPDVCPTTLQELTEVKRLLGPDGDKLQAIFVTVDPERDTTELLKAYVGNFDPGFVALRPTPEQLPAVAKDLFQACGRQNTHQLHHGPLGGKLCL